MISQPPTPDLAKIRRAALTTAALILAILFAQVEVETPLKVAPLGIPILIKKPALLMWALTVTSVYLTLRYVYYGMYVGISPMSAKRKLLSGQPVSTPNLGTEIRQFSNRVTSEINRYFPDIGKYRVEYQVSGDRDDSFLKSLKVPLPIRIFGWLENIDFLLPVIANVIALGAWIWLGRVVS